MRSLAEFERYISAFAIDEALPEYPDLTPFGYTTANNLNNVKIVLSDTVWEKPERKVRLYPERLKKEAATLSVAASY